MSPEEAAYSVMLEATVTLSDCGDFVIVGGWVPDLHFPKKGHAGSIDVDVVLPPDAFDRKVNLHQHLKNSGYRRCEKTTPTRYLRSVASLNNDVAVDLMTTPIYRGNKVESIEIGGVIVGSLAGLDLALGCHDLLTIKGVDTEGKSRQITAKVARPESFILIKAFPLDRRKRAKDAYDIAFVLQHYQPSLSDLAARMAPLIQTDSGSDPL